MQHLNNQETANILEDRRNITNLKQIKISAVVPVFNESQAIEKFIELLSFELTQFSDDFEIIVIDDGSSDNVAAIVETLMPNYPVKLIKLSRNFGKEVALSAGLEHCSGNIAILIDSDFQHPFELIKSFIHKWAEGFDMVYGVQANRINESYIKRIFTKLFYKLMSRISNVNMAANAGDFRLLDRKVIDAINNCKERGKFMKGLYSWVGYSSIGIPFSPPKRTTGTSSWNFAKLTELALLGITSFSNVPLRIWSFIGFFISLVSFICALYVVGKTLILGVDVPGYATLLVTIIFFGGIQLFSIGILGEYLARVFNEVKQRPTYVVDKKVGF